jgi:transposase
VAKTRVATHQKKGQRQQATVVFLDETGFLLQPVNRRTWAPRGETPLQYASARHDRLSAIGAVTLSPQRQRINTYWQFKGGNVVATDVVAFLRHLHRQIGQKLIVVLDRFNVHRKAARLLQEQGASWLSMEWLPAYAPDLNPVEAMWSCTKYGDLANYIPDNLPELGEAVVDSLISQYGDYSIKRSYFKTAKLKL